MMRRFLLLVMATTLALGAATRAQADKKLSPELIDRYDRAGYFTPNFRLAIHDYVEAKEAFTRAQAEQKQFQLTLPALQQQATAAEARTVMLREELAKFDHPEESDFDALQVRANDTAAKPEDVIALAQAYVWTYPTSPHLADAQQYLTLFQGKLAAQQQAVKDALAAQEADRARTLQRAQAHDLTLPEWRDFLHGLSQEDVLKKLGPPSARQDTYWYYQPDWVVMTSGAPKVGLQINFEAGRVLDVDAKTLAAP